MPRPRKRDQPVTATPAYSTVIRHQKRGRNHLQRAGGLTLCGRTIRSPREALPLATTALEDLCLDCRSELPNSTVGPHPKIRVIQQGSSILVLGTGDVPTACRLAGISADTHRWSSTDYGLFVRRQGRWKSCSDYYPPKDARQGVCFVGPNQVTVPARQVRRTADSIVTPQDPVEVLRRHALGLEEHRYQGICPQPDDPQTRDPDCTICLAIDSTATPVAPAPSKEWLFICSRCDWKSNAVRAAERHENLNVEHETIELGSLARPFPIANEPKP